MRDLTTTNDGIRRSTDRIKATGEVFTPVDLVDRMCDKIPAETWADPEKTFLEPTFGSGNMLCRMLERRIASGVSPMDAIRTLYGMELMEDNVKLCKARVKEILKEHGLDITEDVERIIDNNLVCTDFFKWNIQDWRPYNQGELILLGLDKKPEQEIPVEGPSSAEKFLKRKGLLAG